MEVVASYMQLIDRRRQALEQLAQAPSHLNPKYQESVLWHELIMERLHIRISLIAS
jgi:hypothetical protein